MTIRRSSGSPSRRLRIESLEGRSMLSGGSLTPAEAIQQLNAQSAVVATQTSQQQANTLNLENGLLAVAHQLDADNLSQISYANSHGNPQAAVADMQERSIIVAAETRITNEYTLLVQNLLAANQTFKNESALLVTGVSRGTIAPDAAVAQQTTDYEVYKSVSVSTQTQSNSLDQLELVNLSGLTYAVEGIVGQQNLGTFYGPFDVKAVGHTPGVLTDYKGAVTTRFTLSAHLLQGTFTGATTDYLQAFESATSSQLVNQPITGGTITAAVSPSLDTSGFSIHGQVTMNLGPIDNLPSSTMSFQISANLVGSNILTGNLLVGGQKVGSFSWVLR